MQTALAAEVLEITRNAIASNRSPAELAYAIARSRGYVPRNMSAEQTGQGGRPVLSPATAISPQTTAMLDAIARGQKQGHSIGAVPGGGGNAHMTMADLAGLTDAEFQRIYATPQGRALIDGLG